MKTTSRATVDSSSQVLVVDDDRDSVALLRLLLSGAGFDVLTANGVPEALEILHCQAPALVITDFVMPGQTGLDLCRQLRADPRTDALPIVLHTATDPTPEEAAWFDAVFTKPANLHTLLATVQASIARRPALAAEYRGSHLDRSPPHNKRARAARSLSAG